MNNCNFGYDCRNNVDNCLIIDDIIDEIEEVRYIRKYQNAFDPKLKKFISSKLLEQEINEDFDNKISELDTNSLFFSARKNSLEIERKKTTSCCFFYEKKGKKESSERYNKRDRRKKFYG